MNNLIFNNASKSKSEKFGDKLASYRCLARFHRVTRYISVDWDNSAGFRTFRDQSGITRESRGYELIRRIRH